MWRNVAECGGVRRSVADCDVVWRSEADCVCAGVWRIEAE